MTELPAAALAVVDPAANVTPSAPLTPEQAQARLEDLKSSPDHATWREKFSRGDVAARDEFQKLHEAMYRPDGEKPPTQTAQQAAEVEHFNGNLRATADIPEPVADMVRTNQAVSMYERQLAEQEVQRLKSDQEFLKSWYSGNRAARSRMTILSIILARPTMEKSA